MLGINSRDDNRVTLLEAGAGIGAGYATYSYTKTLARKPYGKYILRQLEKLPEDESLEFSRAAKEALKKNHLDKKGVCIVDVNPTNVDKITDAMTRLLNQSSRSKKIGAKNGKTPVAKTKLEKKLEELTKKLSKRNEEKFSKAIKVISEGKNACYIPKIKKVLVNPNKMGFSTFHEMGHAINATSKGFKGALSKSRHFIALLAPVVLFTSLIKKKKAPEEQPKNTTDKVNTFVKNNCGKLMFLAMVPTILEEGLASINAAKIAKDVLKPDMVKKMNTLNAKAWGSYVFGALAMSVCGALSVWVKDRVAQPELAIKKTT